MGKLGELRKGKKKKGLAALREKKKAEADGDKLIGLPLPEPDLSNPWAKKKAKARAAHGAKSDKDDVTLDGLRYCNVREHDGYWTIDVVNGRTTYRFSNRFGSWMIPTEGTHDKPERMTEAKVEVTMRVHARWLKELKRQGRWRGYLLHNEVESQKPKKKDSQKNGKGGDKPKPKGKAKAKSRNGKPKKGGILAAKAKAKA